MCQDRDLYLGIFQYHPARTGDQFAESVVVIDYLDKVILGPHEKIATYHIRYQIVEIHNTKPLRCTLRVISVNRVTSYSDFHPENTLHTQRGHNLFPCGILGCNLPNVGDEFMVEDRPRGVYDEIHYLYSLHRI